MSRMTTKRKRIKPIQLPDYGIWIENHQHQSGFAIGMHSHPYPSLIYIMSGQGKCLTGQAEYELWSNTVLFLKKTQKHQLIDSPGKAMVVFVLYFTERHGYYDKNLVQPLLNKTCIKIPKHYTWQIRAILRQMLHEQNTRPEYFKSALQQSLVNIFIHLNRAVIFEKKQAAKLTSKKSGDRVKAVLDYIRSHYYEQNSLSDVAYAADLSQRQFSNLCIKITGKSYVQFLNALRVKRAEQLIRNSYKPVSAVAFEVGFEELSTFYRAFRKHIGINPSKLRK